MNIFVCASDLAVITGHNTYKDISEIYLKYWKRYFKSDYSEFLQRIKKKKIKLKIDETPEECLIRVGKQHNLDINKMVKNCTNTKGISNFNKDKTKILDQVTKELSKKVDTKQMKKISEAIHQSTNTRFGIKNEDSVVTIYEKLTNNSVEISKKYWKQDIFIIEDDNSDNQPDVWTIGGKVDGISIDRNDNRLILEIKNRVNRLFYTLRDYEKVQIYAYMFALNIKNAHLVECLQHNLNDLDNLSKNINIISVSWDDTFWENEIMVPLNNFADDFYEFINSDSRKLDILKE